MTDKDFTLLSTVILPARLPEAQARLSLLESAMISAEAASNVDELGAHLAEVYTIVGEFPELQLPSL